jgi:tRNA_anti-like
VKAKKKNSTGQAVAWIVAGVLGGSAVVAVGVHLATQETPREKPIAKAASAKKAEPQAAASAKPSIAVAEKKDEELPGLMPVKPVEKIRDGAGDPHHLPRIDARALYAVYRANEVAADQGYHGRLFAVEGVIEDIGKGENGSAMLTLASGSRSSPICCRFDADEAAEVAALEKGQTITIAGNVQGLKNGVKGAVLLIDHCWIPDAADLRR